MTAAGPLVFNPDKRRHTRVNFTRSIKVFAQEQSQGQYPARNLSLGGLFIEGNIDIPVGRDCRLEVHETGRRSSLILNFCGTVLRREKGGVGVKFTNMEEDSYMFLQTMVLYASDDPREIAEHFLEHFVPSAPTC